MFKMSPRRNGHFVKLYLFFFLSLIFSKIGICNENRIGCYDNGGQVCTLCSCSEMNAVVHCNNLTEIPRFLPMNLKVLDLGKNNISILYENSLENCVMLKRLNLSTNNVAFIPASFFRDVSVTHLYLDNNKLDFKSQSSVLLDLENTLTSLYIHKNPPIPHVVIKGLQKLEELHLDGNLKDGFGESFSTLASLKTLTIYPNLTKISNSTFINLKNIKTLSKIILRGAGVTWVDNGAFMPLKALRSLDFGYNYGFHFSLVQQFLNGLSDHLEELVLTNLNDGRNSEIVIEDEFFKVLSKKRNLKILKLNKNKLVKISKRLPIYIRSLTHLDVSKNHLHNATYWPLLFFLLTNLTYLNFDDQDKDPCDPVLENTHVPNYLQISCKSPDIGHIPPCTSPKRFVPKQSYCIGCPRNLREFYYSNTIKIPDYRLPAVMVAGNCKISKHRYRDNGVKMAIGPIVIHRPAANVSVTFDFGMNGMKCFAPEILKYSIAKGLRVDRLILDGNDLSHQLENDVEGKTFAVYSSLKELNLANNKLKTLHQLTFRNLINLEKLDLSSNFLVSLSFAMSHLKNLRKLDLRNNRLVTFVSNDILAFSSLSKREYGSLQLFIEGNALTCSCEYLNFMEWIVKNDTYIDNFNEITCRYSDQRLKLSEIKHMLYDAQISCYYGLPLIISGGLLSLLIICTLVGTIAYKYRWDVRYYLIKRSQRLKRYQMLLDEENDYIYDAFVSYDMNDRSWIVQELIKNIERKPPFTLIKSTVAQNKAKVSGIGSEEALISCSVGNYGTIESNPVNSGGNEESMIVDEAIIHGDDDEVIFRLCIHERDFEAGNEIEANILNAIQTSRMVILIVSNGFVKSKWCRLELELAKMESLERGRNIVVPVLLEPIQETLESLEWFMKRYTYLEWFKCDTNCKKVEFWKRMKLALQGKSKKIICQCGGRRLIDD